MSCRSASILASAWFLVISSSDASSSSGNSPGRRPGGTPLALASGELGGAAAGELGHQHRLLPAGPVLQPPGGLQRPGQLVVGQEGGAGDSLLGQSGQDRAGAQGVGGGVLPELRAERLAAEAVRAEHRRQQVRVQVGGVAQAEADPRALDLPLLRHPRARLRRHRAAPRGRPSSSQGRSDPPPTGRPTHLGPTGAGREARTGSRGSRTGRRDWTGDLRGRDGASASGEGPGGAHRSGGCALAGACSSMSGPPSDQLFPIALTMRTFYRMN